MTGKRKKAESSADRTLTTSQIGRCGELLVQLLLLMRGIESAPMTTDSGVDLVAYSSESAKPATIQVKTNLRPKPGGGKGKKGLDWWIDEKCPAQLVALVDIESQRVWLFTIEEMATNSQQHSGGRHHLYMYTDPTAQPKKIDRRVHDHQFAGFLIENRAHELFA